MGDTSSQETLQAVILCGGLGMRLRSVVPDRPKCLVPIAGRPFLGLLLAWLRFFAIREVTLCLGYGSKMVIEFIEKRSVNDMTVTFAVENEPLGTAGALKDAEPLVRTNPFVVMNGDSIFDVRLDLLTKLHRERNAIATLALVQGRESRRYGNVTVDNSGQITEFRQEGGGDNLLEENPSRTSVFSGGVYVFSKEIFARIPHGPPPVSLERHIFPRLVKEGLWGIQSDGYFLDIGVPLDYARAQVELPQRFPPW